MRSLTLEEFLAESTAAAELVERLVQAGAIPPLADGRFEACGGSFPRPDLTARRLMRLRPELPGRGTPQGPGRGRSSSDHDGR